VEHDRRLESEATPALATIQHDIAPAFAQPVDPLQCDETTRTRVEATPNSRFLRWSFSAGEELERPRAGAGNVAVGSVRDRLCLPEASELLPL
jgi:hypothetical protein